MLLLGLPTLLLGFVAPDWVVTHRALFFVAYIVNYVVAGQSHTSTRRPALKSRCTWRQMDALVCRRFGCQHLPFRGNPPGPTAPLSPANEFPLSLQ